jgi:hypothetical protein
MREQSYLGSKRSGMSQVISLQEFILYHILLDNSGSAMLTIVLGKQAFCRTSYFAIEILLEVIHANEPTQRAD